MSAEAEEIKKEGNEGQENQQQGGGDKVEKAYNSAFGKMVALLKGDKSVFKKARVPKSDIGAVVDELIKERKATAIKTFKEEAVKLLDAKIEFDKQCKAAEDAYKNTVNAKKKEFTEKMQNLFKLVEDIEGIEKSYTASMKAGAAASEESTEKKD